MWVRMDSECRLVSDTSQRAGESSFAIVRHESTVNFGYDGDILPDMEEKSLHSKCRRGDTLGRGNIVIVLLVLGRNIG